MFNLDIYASRVENLKREMAGKGYDSFLILKEENIYYLTGFRGRGSASILFVGDTKCSLLVHFIYCQQAKQSISPDIEIVEYRADKFKVLNELLDPVGNTGIEDSIAYDVFEKIKRMFQKKGKNLSAVKGMVEKLRAVKDADEIENIKKACSAADSVCKWLMDMDKDFFLSKTEQELALDIEKKIFSMGGDGKSFDMVVANRQNSCLPHYRPARETIQPGALLIDCGAEYKNYCSDITRTFFLGLKKTGKFKKIYDIVLKAQIKAISMCREGISCSQLDMAARSIIENEGFGDNFGHGLGHGVGIEIHEAPVLNQASGEMLRAGMVVTIEPGIYVQGLGGVRIEDMVLVKKDGCQVLFETAKNFININS